MTTVSYIVPNAAEMLVGHTLEGGWRVLERLPSPPGATGSHFSVGYRVEHPDGRRGFCKALNYAEALADPAGTPDALRSLTEEYIFERDLHQKCALYHMSRIVIALDDGRITIPGCPIPQVDYIMFELADCDIRRELTKTPDLDLTLRLRTLHNIAVAVSQLHQRDIAHQDIKPSNILTMTDDNSQRSSKLGDLGRATDANRPALHDICDIAGAPAYAPPEQLYGAIPTEFAPRRLGCDLYQLGSLATFLFTATTVNSLLMAELHPGHSWLRWTGTYEEVLPYVQDAFSNVLESIHAALPEIVADRLTPLIQCLCEPDPLRRGHPVNHRYGGNPYGLQRMVTEFDLLARRAAQTSRTKVA
jgi:serine/threonine protein kinase